jgi:hypothetical protein
MTNPYILRMNHVSGFELTPVGAQNGIFRGRRVQNRSDRSVCLDVDLFGIDEASQNVCDPPIRPY